MISLKKNAHQMIKIKKMLLQLQIIDFDHLCNKVLEIYIVSRILIRKAALSELINVLFLYM